MKTADTFVTILSHDASTNIVHCSTKLGRVVTGDNVIVGVGSVVTHDLPGNAVYAGSPVRYICSIKEYEERYAELYQIRPHFDDIHPWNEWNSATDEERKEMREKLEDGIGFI